ncbi:hypothetical protein HMPREF9192_1857 [Streptococcus vestibularis F0396]|uniref:Transcription-repair coupling factor n=1 Tax=Streptococcus vestibularis F0396 TaxID=904306 RepID=E3CSU3_STRVE|nr:hypothetical protein HMPREF9192_1857 [Streptococcus vestibularis F0396]
MANTLLDLFEKNHQLLEWRDKISLLSRQLVMGFSGSSKAVVMASALSEQVPKILIVTSTQNEAEQLTGDLSAILGEDKVYSFLRMMYQLQSLSSLLQKRPILVSKVLIF